LLKDGARISHWGPKINEGVKRNTVITNMHTYIYITYFY
jgi:hypothetical protein